MAIRDIKQTGPQAPSAASTSGFGFATGASRYNPEAAKPQGSGPDTMSQLAKLQPVIESVMQTANENAFKQGQVDQASDMLNMGNTVDSAAKLIEKSSWLTRDAYTQGVRSQQFSESQLETQQEIARIAQESADRGDSIEVFSQKIKPTLAKLNTKVTALGLKGPAKDVAHDQILSYVVAAQKTYQQERENIALQNYTNAANQNASAGFSILTGTVGAVESANALGIVAQSQFQVEAYNPKQQYDNTGKRVKSVLDGVLSNMNPASAEDQARLVGYAAYLRSDDSILIPQEHRAKMLAAIGDKQKEFNQMNVLNIDNTLRSYETQHNSGTPVDPALLQEAGAGIMRMIQMNQISPTQGNDSLNRLHKLGLKVDAELGKSQLVGNADISQRRAYGIKDEDQTKYWQTTFGKIAEAQGAPEVAGVLTVKAGLQYQNYPAITRGHELLVGSYMSSLTMNPETFSENPNGLAQRAFLADKEMFTQAIVNNDAIGASYQYKAWNQQLGADGAAAMDMLMADPAVKTVEDAMARYPGALSKIQETRAVGGLGNVQFTRESLKSGLFGKMLGFKSTFGAELGKGADDQLLDIKAIQLQMLYNANKAELITKHTIVGNDGGQSALKAMQAEGMLVDTKFGTAMMDTRTKLALGRGSMPTQDSIDRIDTDIRTRMVLELNDGAVPVAPENILIKYNRGGATVLVYSDNTFSDDSLIAQKSIPMTTLQNMDQQTLELETSQSRPVGVTTTYLPGGGVTTTPSYEDTGVFGSNQFKVATLQKISADEGYLRVPTATDKDRPDVKVVGHSVSLATYESMFGKEQLQQFIAAAQDPTSVEYSRMYDEFLNMYFKDFPTLLQDAGLKVSGLFSDTEQATVLASTYYHGPSSAKVLAKAMRSVREGGSVKQAINDVQATPAYTQAGTKRRKEMIDAVVSLQ